MATNHFIMLSRKSYCTQFYYYLFTSIFRVICKHKNLFRFHLMHFVSHFAPYTVRNAEKITQLS
jgi:hypothetical protein